MQTRIYSYALEGIEARRVAIDVVRRPGRQQFDVDIVGFTDFERRESRERVRSAIFAAGFELPAATVFVSVDPHPVRMCGRGGLDAAIAVAVLVAAGAIEAPGDEVAIVGCLGLEGEIRGVRGMLPIAEAARRDRCDALVVARCDLDEAAIVDGCRLIAVDGLGEIPAALAVEGRDDRPDVGRVITASSIGSGRQFDDEVEDVSDESRAAVREAVQRRRHVLLVSRPGADAAWLARAIPALLPEMTDEEARDVTRIHSACGLSVAHRPLRARPLRIPHSATSPAGLVGGGRGRLGEVSLAHNGVLLLEHVDQFEPEALREVAGVLAERSVTMFLGSRLVRFPADALVVGTIRSCPCGFDGMPECRCDDGDRQLHARTLDRVGGLFDETIVVT